VPLIVGSVAVAIGLGWARSEFRADQARNQRSLERTAPPIHPGYRLFGRGSGGVQVGMLRAGNEMSWRVNSDGSNRCRPTGHSTLWNFVDGYAEIGRGGRFRVMRSYSTTDTAGDGEEYDKQVKYRFEGRFARQQATGTFWRRDRFYDGSELRFTCVREGRWTANEL
jgi:hypothetical protein